jgi:hypothetical protein
LKEVSRDRVRDDLLRPSCFARKQNHSIMEDFKF